MRAGPFAAGPGAVAGGAGLGRACAGCPQRVGREQDTPESCPAPPAPQVGCPWAPGIGLDLGGEAATPRLGVPASCPNLTDLSAAGEKVSWESMGSGRDGQACK